MHFFVVMSSNRLRENAVSVDNPKATVSFIILGFKAGITQNLNDVRGVELDLDKELFQIYTSVSLLGEGWIFGIHSHL